jgi:flavin reductase (DIM6/NTAB) family NADH-FMN oxidoreductase RutF
MISLDPKEEKTAKIHAIMLGSIAPRPIALASTIGESGIPNLSPFSFYNCFGAKPPILIFSPARRVRDNTIKHTLENILLNSEVVINAVNYGMVNQISLASSEFPEGVNEFEKAGLTPIPSVCVKPFRVKESPVQFECRVKEVIPTGTEGGAGNLVICEILMIHLDETILTDAGKIDPYKIDLVARMGDDWYCRANGDSLFEVEKPLTKVGIGIDSIPENIRRSDILSGNDLGKLGNIEFLPSFEEIENYKTDHRAESVLFLQNEQQRHLHAKSLLSLGNTAEAWKVLLMK